MGNPVVSLLAHRGPVRSLAVDASGRYLVTAGADAQVKVWDVRTFRSLHAYFSATPASAVDVSQRGMLAVAYGPHVQVRCAPLSMLIRRRELTACGRADLERRVERESFCTIPEPPAGWWRHQRRFGALLPVRRRAGRRSYQRHLLAPGAEPQPLFAHPQHTRRIAACRRDATDGRLDARGFTGRNNNRGGIRYQLGCKLRLQLHCASSHAYPAVLLTLAILAAPRSRALANRTSILSSPTPSRTRSSARKPKCTCC